MNVTCKLMLLQKTTEVKRVVEINSKHKFFQKKGVFCSKITTRNCVRWSSYYISVHNTDVIYNKYEWL